MGYMKDKTSKQTLEQLEQNLSERIQVLYLTQLGHQPNKVSCQLIDKTLTIVVENPITQPEQLLVQSGKRELAEQVRFNIHKAFQPQLKVLIEDVIGVELIELVGDSQLHTGRTIIIAILAATPKMITPSTLAKTKQQQTVSDSDSDE